MSDTVSGAPHDSLIGTELAGRFTLVELLGSGGMGTVYKARQLPMNTFVAVKLLRPGAAVEASGLQRLQQEAKLLAALNHPAIPKVHCIETMADGGIFLAIDFIDGVSLHKQLETYGKLPPEVAISITLQIADALQHAHDKSVIHRDLKPGNIMLSGDGTNTQAYVLDFGIAKRLEGSQKFTQTGAILGTAYYMSPEQARGEPVDARSDIYSLACVLYEMLTGRRLFEGETHMEVLLRHVQETSPDLNVPELAPYSGVLAKALAKNPSGRFQSMQQFVDALKAPSAFSAPSVRRWPKPNKSFIVAVTCVGLVIALVLGAEKLMYRAPLSEEEACSIIEDAVKKQKYDSPQLDQAISAVQDKSRDTLKDVRMTVLLSAAFIRIEQGRKEEAKQLLLRSLEFSDELGRPGVAIKELAALEAELNLSSAIRLLQQQIAKDDQKGRGASREALSNRFALAQMLEYAGRISDSCMVYNEIAMKSTNFQYKAIGTLGCADMFNELGNHGAAAKVLAGWWKDNGNKPEAWEFVPWAANIRAGAFLYNNPQAQKDAYTFAHNLAIDELQRTHKRYLDTHPTAQRRMWRAKAVAEIGIAKDEYKLSHFHESSQWMDAAQTTAHDSNDPMLDVIVKRLRVVEH